MAGDNDCRRVDIFVLDNKADLGYVDMLKDLGYNVELVRDAKDRGRMCNTGAKVFIFGYALGHKEGSGSYECIVDESDESRRKVLKEGLITGILFAKCVKEWDDGVKRYVHIVSDYAVKKTPSGSDLSWKEMKDKSMIDSYSTRKPEDFSRHLDSIVKAMIPDSE